MKKSFIVVCYHWDIRSAPLAATHDHIFDTSCLRYKVIYWTLRMTFTITNLIGSESGRVHRPLAAIAFQRAYAYCNVFHTVAQTPFGRPPLLTTTNLLISGGNY
jgi:hypothetical protein